ncbi:MAG: hypothetical protein EPO09_02420 [Aquabacterium sp.]|uniref:hypothetical protein n=1 Tax=Aquabacterium sp. TaxID=1872578 RepID=UPI001228C560|nr:hypothetical protein [Aquabacterium sp.]TAK98434.1 MAG: hypothetical protein EPO09_02420 [Aquabacterium sp.]
MTDHLRRPSSVALAALLVCASAHADYHSADGNFSLSGFGTLGITRSSTDDAIFNYPGQGGGATKRASPDPDSKLAVQGTYKFSPTVSATAQVMTKYDAEGQYIPSMEWAFAKWQAMPGLSLRAGRMGAPFFMISDFRDVNYTSTAVRPNLEVYGQVPVSQFEGVDASYELNLGNTTLTSSVWTGNTKANYATALTGPTDEIILKQAVGVNVLADLGNGFTLRVGRSHGKLTVNSESARLVSDGANSVVEGSQAYAALAPGAAGATSGATSAAISASIPGALANADGAAQVSDLLNPKGVDSSFTGIGLGYDQDNWVASLEYTKRKTKSFIADTTGWYGLVGYRVGKFTPYVGYAKLTTDRTSSSPVQTNSLANSGNVDPDFDELTRQVNQGVADLSAGVSMFMASQFVNQKTSTLGVRWDVHSGLALKAQFDRITKDANSVGTFLIPDPTTASGQAFTASKKVVNVISLSVDFVF